MGQTRCRRSSSRDDPVAEILTIQFLPVNLSYVAIPLSLIRHPISLWCLLVSPEILVTVSWTLEFRVMTNSRQMSKLRRRLRIRPTVKSKHALLSASCDCN
jgi:hypothetical protein